MANQTKGPPKDPLAFQLFVEIGIIEQLARTQLERQLPDGLKISQFGVLSHLVRRGGDWSPARLAAAFQVTKGAMTNTLQRLEVRGLVEILADDHDGRAKIVRLTVEGRKMRELCAKNMSPFIADLSKEITENELHAALPVLEKIRKYLDSHRA